MDVNDFDGWKVAQIASSLVVAVLGALGMRSLSRLDSLEKSAVTRDELNGLLAQMRSDRVAMHAENQEHLRRMEEKIDANEVRDANTRHDIRETVHAVSLQVAVLVERGRPG
jgi:hypothetical protein